MRQIIVRALLIAPLTVVAVSPAHGQYREVEFTPTVGYIWGGGFNTQANVAAPAGRLEVADALGYGAEVGFSPNGRSWFELTYMRQDSDLTFRPNNGGASTSAGFATNYIHVGGRQEFGVSPRIHPFIGGGLGLTVYDVKEQGFGTNTQFSMSLAGGARMSLGKSDKVGLRLNLRGWFSFVPSGTYGTWCGFYGCFVTEGTASVTQGEVSGGLVFKF
jgi:hypothetical protein